MFDMYNYASTDMGVHLYEASLTRVNIKIDAILNLHTVFHVNHLKSIL